MGAVASPTKLETLPARKRDEKAEPSADDALSLPVLCVAHFKPPGQSLIQNVTPQGADSRLFLNVELNGKKLLEMLDDESVHSFIGNGLSRFFTGKLASRETGVKVFSESISSMPSD